MEGVKGLVWALVSGFNCPLCQIGDNKQFEALSCFCSSLPSLLPPARGEATDRTLKQDVSVKEVNLRCDGVANITASFIDTDCSDTSKSGPINLQAGGGVTGACEGAVALQHSNKCLFDLLYRHLGGLGTRDAASLSRGWRDNVVDQRVYSVSDVTCAGCGFKLFDTVAVSPKPIFSYRRPT